MRHLTKSSAPTATVPGAGRPRIVLTATTDLTYDQRMRRASAALAAAGYEVLLVGRVLPGSRPLDPAEPFSQHRLRCRFHRGKLFYLEFNLRLAWWLLGQSAPAAYAAADLDTALPVWLAACLKRRPWLYDAHELFTELPEIVGRPAVQRVWRWIERFVVPRATRACTTGPAIAEVFRQRYGRAFTIVRNVPAGRSEERGVRSEEPEARSQKSEVGANSIRPPDQGEPGGTSAQAGASRPCLLIYQGALNVGRGLEELLDALPLVDPRASLIICGEGDLSASLRARVAADPLLVARVEFKGYVVPAELRRITAQATIGTMLLQHRGLSYYLSLANKFFDYVQAGVPQVCIDFPEYRALNEEIEVAELVPDLTPATLAAAINRLLRDPARHALLAANCRRAAQVWTWEREQTKLVALVDEMTGRGVRRD